MTTPFAQPKALPQAGTRNESLIGALVVVVALALLSFFYFFGHSSAGGGYDVTARMAKVDGLGIGTEVRLAGIKVGSVTALDLDPKSYLVTVHMRIDDAIKIPTDSSLAINSAGLLASSYLSISPGGDDKMIAAGGTIENTQSINANDIMNLLGRFTTGSGGK
ncbi:MAG: outer membrane lipid asymmetry maintenance protein MlaD [Alphaproteobacteria bacterium]|nr:outer membrane lipid asymmetry maintenance protein MlaD [Alphaproteobacteria bacterium]